MQRSAPKQRAIEAAYGKPFWDVAMDLKNAGLSPSEAAAKLGYSLRCFSALRARNSQQDPWPERKSAATTVAEAWAEEHDEPLTEAIERLAQFHPKSKVREMLGFKSSSSFERYLDEHDIDVKFNRTGKLPAEPVPYVPASTTHSKGGTPGVIYTRRRLGEPAFPEQARERPRIGRLY